MKDGVMVMGDMVLFEDEVNPVMSVALDKGLEVTALHNHFFFDEPKVYFMHIVGEGPADKLAEGVRAIFDKVKETVRRMPSQQNLSVWVSYQRKARLMAKRLAKSLGRKGMRTTECIRSRLGEK
jgi:hypothetical protein